MPITNSNAAKDGSPLRFIDVVLSKLCTFVLYRKQLWHEIQHFGSWLELEAARVANEENQSIIFIELDNDSTVKSLRIGLKKHPHQLNRFKELWAFLKSLDIENIKLDARLERNQFEDILRFLYCYQQRIKNHNSGKYASGIIGHLFNPDGIHISCTQTYIQNRTLMISYSYCTLQFSHIVHWFERKNKHFDDHRTLFYAAPRYALIITLFFTGPSIIYAAFFNHFYLMLIMSLAAITLFGLIYILFMVVGSIEYDNEEKTHNLTKTNKQLEKYTHQIQADIRRAKIIQEKFLPDAENMPFKGEVEWAHYFIPATEVGGDYFDVKKIDENRIAILFSDVCGHGMAAAFITAILKTTFHTWIEEPSSLKELVKKLNTNLYRLTPDDTFGAIFVASYNYSSCRLDYINAGHNPEPWLIPCKKTEPIISLNKARNMILGVQEEVDIVISHETLRQGDIILLASDGVIENRNVDGEQYGIERLEELLKTQRESTAQDMVGSIIEKINIFSRDAEPDDDRTILAFQIKHHDDNLC